MQGHGRYHVSVTHKDGGMVIPPRDRYFPTRNKAEVYRQAMLAAGYSASIHDTLEG